MHSLDKSVGIVWGAVGTHLPMMSPRFPALAVLSSHELGKLLGEIAFGVLIAAFVIKKIYDGNKRPK